MNVILVFTFGVSLKDWFESGLLSREIKIYEEILKKEDIQFSFITFGDETDCKFINNPKIKILPAYKYLNKSNSKLLNFLKSFRLPFILQKELNDVDLIKTNQLNGSWIGIILKQLIRKPLMLRTGYNAYEFKVLDKSSFFVKLFYKQLTKLAYSKSDIFTVTSSSDKKSISKLCNNSEKLVLHRNYVTNLKYQDFNKRDKNKIISVGRLSKQKNYSQLIKLFQNTNFEINIIGDGYQKDYLIKLSDEKNCKLNLLGNFQNDKVQDMFKKFRFFFSTSLYEGNPKALLEAMSSGCIVFTTRNENSSEIIEDGENGFFIDENRDILGLISNLNDNLNYAQEITKNAYKTIEKNYLLKKIVDDEINIYKSLIF